MLLVPENMSTWNVVLCSCIVVVEGNDAQRKTIIIFPLAPMVVLAPGSAHAIPSALPHIDMSGNFPVHMSPSNIYINPSEVISEVSDP